MDGLEELREGPICQLSSWTVKTSSQLTCEACSADKTWQELLEFNSGLYIIIQDSGILLHIHTVYIYYNIYIFIYILYILCILGSSSVQVCYISTSLLGPRFAKTLSFLSEPAPENSCGMVRPVPFGARNVTIGSLRCRLF